MEYRTTRLNFIQQCSYSVIAFSTPQSLSHFSVSCLQNYTFEGYKRDVRTAGLCETWMKICDSLILHGEPKSGLLVFSNLPHLYRQGCELVGRDTQTLDIERPVSKAVVSYLKRCSGDGLCGLNCGTGIQLLDYLSTLETDDVRRLIAKRLLRLYDSDKLAMRICATAIAVRYKLQGIGGIELTHISPGQKIMFPEGLRVFACDAGNSDSPMMSLLKTASSAVVLTSRSVDMESVEANYPAEIRNWCGSVVTFGSSDEGRLALIVIESKSQKGNPLHDIG